MVIIPAIDIIEGKCVRLEQGDFNRKKIYNEDPLEVAKEFEDAGLSRLHLVDLDGARSGRVLNWKVLERIAARTTVVIDFGGGIKSEEDVKVVFNSGAAMATIGSIAVLNEPVFMQWIKTFGADKFLLGADVKNEKIAINGWQVKTDVWVYDLLEKYMASGIAQAFCTDISKDGILEGPSIELYKRIIEKFPILNLIASGGVSSIKDIEDLHSIGCKGAIIGKAIYENKIPLADLKNWSMYNAK